MFLDCILKQWNIVQEHMLKQKEKNQKKINIKMESERMTMLMQILNQVTLEKFYMQTFHMLRSKTHFITYM